MEAEGKLHIVVFPWLAFGHMLPFLELSKSLARRGQCVSYITTPKNLKRLPAVVPPEISHLIHFVSLPLPRADGIADGVEATSDLPPEDIHYLVKAMDGLERPLRTFLAGASPKRPDWIVHDFMQHWVPRAAAEAGVPSVFFASHSAASLARIGSPSGLSSGAGVMRRLQASFEGCSAMAVRSCRELEGEWLSALEKVHGKPAIPVSLLPPTVHERTHTNTSISSSEEAEALEWLSHRNAASVVYVALGSEVALSVELTHELALGLEQSGLPFLWALRRPSSAGGSEVEMLPEGFEGRVGSSSRGKVVIGWVPQLKVLAHPSVGGFLTHCGWGSVVESLHAGHPLVMLPVSADRWLNARMLEEKGVGVEVERKGEVDGSFTRNEVKKALSLIMVEEEGGAYRKRAQQMKVLLADKECREKYLDEFVQYLLSNITSNSHS